MESEYRKGFNLSTLSHDPNLVAFVILKKIWEQSKTYSAIPRIADKIVPEADILYDVFQ